MALILFEIARCAATTISHQIKTCARMGAHARSRHQPTAVSTRTLKSSSFRDDGNGSEKSSSAEVGAKQKTRSRNDQPLSKRSATHLYPSPKLRSNKGRLDNARTTSSLGFKNASKTPETQNVPRATSATSVYMEEMVYSKPNISKSVSNVKPVPSVLAQDMLGKSSKEREGAKSRKSPKNFASATEKLENWIKFDAALKNISKNEDKACKTGCQNKASCRSKSATKKESPTVVKSDSPSATFKSESLHRMLTFSTPNVQTRNDIGEVNAEIMKLRRNKNLEKDSLRFPWAKKGNYVDNETEELMEIRPKYVEHIYDFQKSGTIKKTSSSLPSFNSPNSSQGFTKMPDKKNTTMSKRETGFILINDTAQQDKISKKTTKEQPSGFILVDSIKTQMSKMYGKDKRNVVFANDNPNVNVKKATSLNSVISNNPGIPVKKTKSLTGDTIVDVLKAKPSNFKNNVKNDNDSALNSNKNVTNKKEINLQNESTTSIREKMKTENTHELDLKKKESAVKSAQEMLKEKRVQMEEAVSKEVLAFRTIPAVGPLTELQTRIVEKLNKNKQNKTSEVSNNSAKRNKKSKRSNSAEPLLYVKPEELHKKESSRVQSRDRINSDLNSWTKELSKRLADYQALSNDVKRTVSATQANTDKSKKQVSPLASPSKASQEIKSHLYLNSLSFKENYGKASKTPAPSSPKYDITPNGSATSVSSQHALGTGLEKNRKNAENQDKKTKTSPILSKSWMGGAKDAAANNKVGAKKTSASSTTINTMPANKTVMSSEKLVSKDTISERGSNLSATEGKKREKVLDRYMLETYEDWVKVRDKQYMNNSMKQNLNSLQAKKITKTSINSNQLVNKDKETKKKTVSGFFQRKTKDLAQGKKLNDLKETATTLDAKNKLENLLYKDICDTYMKIPEKQQPKSASTTLDNSSTKKVIDLQQNGSSVDQDRISRRFVTEFQPKVAVAEKSLEEIYTLLRQLQQSSLALQSLVEKISPITGAGQQSGDKKAQIQQLVKTFDGMASMEVNDLVGEKKQHSFSQKNKEMFSAKEGDLREKLANQRQQKAYFDLMKTFEENIKKHELELVKYKKKLTKAKMEGIDLFKGK
ncbi:uncharacterized protein LOC131957830 [Physella acuta]|uniref:uncharacterized protein LOC131957830 n=1 Tax=Physella acuta TaxID=109671 RepID=UPI0027DEAA69|nr:uncharacterized protein LOC131957830 [Physella acuta]